MNREIRDNRLFFDGCDTVELAKEYGTPLYVISKSAIEEKHSELKECFLDKYPNTRVAYAAKAFSNIGMFKIVDSLGMSIDVVSAGELYTAIKAGFPGEKIEFNGNNKLKEELELAMDYGVGRIIVDNYDEVPMLDEICKEKGKTMNLLVRVSPSLEMEGATHAYITTAGKDTKFGVPLGDGTLEQTLSAIMESDNLKFMGLHFHVGSQLLTNEHHVAALEKVLTIVKHIKDEYAVETEEINLGGGFGIRYTASDRVPPFSYFLDPVMERLQEFFVQEGMKMPNVVIEPGRSMIGEAGLTLYTVGTIKRIKDGSTYVAVDGGMTDNIRVGLYQAEYEGIVANKAEEPFTQTVKIAGKCCESTDSLMTDASVPEVERGDIYAMFSTGAYGYAMAMNYNRIPIPAVVLVKDGESELMVNRQSYDSMISNDIADGKLF